MTTPTPPVPPPPKRNVAPKPRVAPPPAAAQRQAKTFEVVPWTGHGEGQKTVIYGPSGVGKTSLLALLQGHVSGRVITIGLDDGGRLIRNGKTGEPLLYAQGVESYQDVRDFLHTFDFQPGDVVGIDTITKLEEVSTAYVCETIPTEKGARVDSIEGYGFGKGYRHLLDALRLVLADLDALVRRGVHVVLLAQEASARIANAEGTDYLQDGPKLWHSNQYSSRLEVCEWADHVLRIGYHGTTVVPEATIGNNPARKGKIVGDTVRAVYAKNEVWFFAKSRTVAEPVISYENPADDTIWSLIFDGGAA